MKRTLTMFLALAGGMLCCAETPPMPPGYTEDPDAWMNEIEWPQFSTQSPKGNETDPLAIVPAGKTPAQFSDLFPTRLNLSISVLPHPGYDGAETNDQCYARSLVVLLGEPGRKLVWVGNRFTNECLNGYSVLCDRLVTIAWNQETNHLVEVEWSDDLKQWQSLEHIQYTGQWSFETADAMTEQRRFYRLRILTP